MRIRIVYCILLNSLEHFRWIKEEYNNPEVLITENGWSDAGEMKDVGRIEYLREHLKQMLDVVLDENCNLKGYTGTVVWYCQWPMRDGHLF